MVRHQTFVVPPGVSAQVMYCGILEERAKSSSLGLHCLYDRRWLSSVPSLSEIISDPITWGEFFPSFRIPRRALKVLPSTTVEKSLQNTVGTEHISNDVSLMAFYSITV